MKLYRRVQPGEAEHVMAKGFEDHTGQYMTDRAWTGVWVSDRPLGCMDGAPLTATVLLEIDLRASESHVADYEWVEVGKVYREWLIPAELLNSYACIRVVSDEEEAALVESGYPMPTGASVEHTQR